MDDLGRMHTKSRVLLAVLPIRQQTMVFEWERCGRLLVILLIPGGGESSTYFLGLYHIELTALPIYVFWRLLRMNI